MNPVAVCCFLMFFGTVSPAVAQETRTFSEAQCSYTLPGEGWEWLDPQLVQMSGGDTIAFAKNQKGIAFTLRFDHLKANEKSNSGSYESFESGLLESGRMKKLGGKHLSFKGVPSYQIDVQMPKGRSGSIRILYANSKFYHLQVINALGPLGPEEEWEAIFQGFNFTSLPQPTPPSNEEAAFRQGQQFGQSIFILIVVGIMGLLAVGAVVLVVFLIHNNKRKETPLGRKEPGD